MWTRRASLVAHAAVAAGLAWAAVAASSCSGGCSLRQVQQFTKQGVVTAGGVAFQNVSLAFKNIQIQLASTQFGDQTGRVDAFLTSPDCTTLFDAPYTGAATSPLCRIYVGPVTAGKVSALQTVPPAQYSYFAQSYAVNDATAQYLFDIEIWTDNCSSTLLSP